MNQGKREKRRLNIDDVMLDEFVNCLGGKQWWGRLGSFTSDF